MNPLQKDIHNQIKEHSLVLQRLNAMKKLVSKKARKPAPRRQPRVEIEALAAPAAPASATKRQKVIAQLIGILHSMGVTSPNIGPASIYANPPIGFSGLKMLAYCQTCRAWFGCPGLADQSAQKSVNEMATAVIGAGGEPR